ncbi:MAG TPA: hypothetical protein VFR14_12325 [Candidatus Limnocylindrales bacterium]|nr:hypothetical protein [Candidatus Limnocylindrales bacterium]
MTPTDRPDLPPSGLTWTSAMLAAALAALGRPGTWVIALAGFLVRGGVVVLLAPIVVIPSTIGVANAVAPTLTPALFGQAAPAFVALVAGLVVGLTAWIIVGGLIGAWADLAMVRAAAADEELESRPVLVERPGAVWRGLAVRLVALIPLAAAIAWGSTRIVDAAYREIILPDELTTPIVLRVLRDVPDAVGLIAIAWLLGETVGGLAQRRLWSSGDSILGALGRAIVGAVRRPGSTLSTLLLTNAVVAVAVVPPALVAGIAWDRLRVALATRAGATELAATLALFVGLWLAALLLAGAGTAWRSYAWTAEAARAGRRSSPALGARTIGEPEVGRPGEWPSPDASGSL